ncbi:MAG: hypothetical protein OEZ58_05750 [Gammaproteobacteria bacterium]|nr:hypothetical protein [Gammaproteobacteria bacterium]
MQTLDVFEGYIVAFLIILASAPFVFLTAAFMGAKNEMFFWLIISALVIGLLLTSKAFKFKGKSCAEGGYSDREGKDSLSGEESFEVRGSLFALIVHSVPVFLFVLLMLINMFFGVYYSTQQPLIVLSVTFAVFLIFNDLFLPTLFLMLNKKPLF